MQDEDDYERIQSAATTRRGGSKAAGRLALRVLLQRLAWMDGTLLYWTGSPAPSPARGATDVLQRRLRGLTPGAYSLRMRPGNSPGEFKSYSGFIEAVAPAIEELVPINLPLIARSLRRLQDARRFTRLLPQTVGDVSEWRVRCDEALCRARVLMDAISVGDPDAIGRAALVIGVIPQSGGTRRRDATNKAKRATPRAKPDAPFACRGLSSWPADLLHQIVRFTGEMPDRLARACPAANDPSVAAAVRDRLLIAPRAVGDFIRELPSLLALADRLAEEPARRLSAAVAIQRTALEQAVTHSGLSGNPLSAFRRTAGTPISIPLQRFCHYYTDHVTAELASWYSPLPGDSFDVWGNLLAPAAELVVFFGQLLTAGQLRRSLLPQTRRDRTRKRLVRWRQIGVDGHLLISGETDVLTFEQLPEMAARLLRASVHLSPDSFPRDAVLTLAAHGAIGDVHAAAGWVEWCCHVWPIGATHREHAEAALLALHVAYAQSPPEHRPAALAMLGTLAVQLVERAVARKTHLNPGQRLFHSARLIVRAVAAGLTSEQVIGYFNSNRTSALEQIIDIAPDRVKSFDAWLELWSGRLTRDLSANVRDYMLSAYSVNGSASRCWADAFILFGTDLLSRLMAMFLAFDLEPRLTCSAIQSLAALVNDGSPALYDAESVPATDKLEASRALLSAALPALRSTIRRAIRHQPDKVLSAVTCFVRYLGVARLSLAETSATPAEVAAFAANCLALHSRRTGATALAMALFEDHGRTMTDLLVALACRSPERMVSLCLANVDLTWREIEQAAEAWRQLRRIDPLPEIVSASAAREGRAPRALRLLARLGLAFRLSGTGRLRLVLSKLAVTPADPLPPEIAGLAGHVSPEQSAMLSELLHWRSDHQLPDRILETLRRPATLAHELSSLLDRADLNPSARRRTLHLQKILADPAALADWMSRDLDKHLSAALDDARLERLEQQAAAAVASHFAMLSLPMPVARTPREERNWDNAVRLYFSVDYNRALLRRLLSHEVRGDRAWIVEQPRNAQFLADARKRGVDTDAWLAPFSRTVDSPAGPLRIEVETDPLHVLQMGNYFETCLSESGVNSFSTIANAVEVNKRVIYVYDHRQVVIGRKLIVLTRDLQLVGFCTYGTLPQPRSETADTDKHEALKELVDAFCSDFARGCGVSLHPYGHRKGPHQLRDDKTFTLFARWYNDGAEPFGEQWLAAGAAQPPHTRASPAKLRPVRPN